MNLKKSIPSRLVVGLIAICMSIAPAVSSSVAEEPLAPGPEFSWWKGNLHTHSLWSDGDDFPEMIAQWYRDRGYHFLAMSDHNVLSEGKRWMKVEDVLKRGGNDVIEKYTKQFGSDWVELRGDREELPSEVRLKPFDEFRSLLDERGRFLMIQSEEISDNADGKPVHINAANLSEVIEPQRGESVRDTIANNFRAIMEQEKAKGREILPHLNHPNFGWAVTAEDLAFVTTDRFYEVYNGHPSINHLGDATRPSVERIWDIANAIRLIQLNAHPLFGLGTDDSHHYHGTGGSRPGRGWVMVRSRYLTPEHVILAMKRGDFYASSGVTLTDVSFDVRARSLRLVIQPMGDSTYQTVFVGTKVPVNASLQSPDALPSLPPMEEIGKVLATVDGLTPTYELAEDDLYVRAVVTSSLAAVDPSFVDQKQQAWTQPVGWNLDNRKQPDRE